MRHFSIYFCMCRFKYFCLKSIFHHVSLHSLLFYHGSFCKALTFNAVHLTNAILFLMTLFPQCTRWCLLSLGLMYSSFSSWLLLLLSPLYRGGEMKHETGVSVAFLILRLCSALLACFSSFILCLAVVPLAEAWYVCGWFSPSSHIEEYCWEVLGVQSALQPFS